MLAQLLGMGRVKKDKDKEREKGLAREDAEAGGEGQVEDLVPLGNGSFSSGEREAEAGRWVDRHLLNRLSFFTVRLLLITFIPATWFSCATWYLV